MISHDGPDHVFDAFPLLLYPRVNVRHVSIFNIFNDLSSTTHVNALMTLKLVVYNN